MSTRRRSPAAGGRAAGSLHLRVAALLIIGVTASIVSFQLFVSPVVGLADNGDFEKVMGIVGLRYPPELTRDQRYFRWVHTRYAFAEPNWWRSGYLTSETPLARAARILARSSAARSFDLRWLAAVHAGLFIAFFGAIVLAYRRGNAARFFGATVAAAVFFTDVGYVSVMNSFYSQEASYLALFGLLGVLAAAAARGRFTPGSATAYLLMAVFFVTSKPQEWASSIPLAAFAAVAIAPARGLLRAIGVAAAVLILGSGLWYFRRIDPEMREREVQRVVFGQILAGSPEPDRDRQELGIASVPGAEKTPTPTAVAGTAPRFERKPGRVGIVLFYLRHPARAAVIVGRTARAAMVLRPPAYGNLPFGSGAAERRQSRAFSAWSTVRATAAPGGAAVLAFVFGGAALVAFRQSMHRDRRIAAFAILLLVAVAALDFGACGFGSLSTDRERHLFAFDAVTDALLAVGIGEAAHGVAARRRGRPGDRPVGV